MLRHFILSAVIIGLTAAGSACAQQVTPDQPASAQPSGLPLEGIAAIVNDKPISFTDVRQRARLVLLSLGGGQPTPEQINQVTRQALENLVDEVLQLQKAAEFEVEVEPAEITSAVDDMARQSGTTRDNLNAQLLSAGINPTSLEDQLRAEIAWSRIMGGLFGSRIRVSENQVDGQLNRLRNASSKTQYQLSEIFLYAPDEATRAEALKAADTIAQQLQQGADFRVAAQRLSSAPTAASGGNMGWMALEDLAPELQQAVSQLSGPGLTPPIPVSNGVYLLLVRNKREPSGKITKVNLTRLLTTSGTDKDLIEAVESAKSCEDARKFASANANVTSADLTDINVDDLGPEGRSLVLATPVGGATDIFAASGGLAVLFVCDRQDGSDALPSREAIKNNLHNRELSMIAERELRNLRREATIIYR